jgi:hypothetical protein
MGVLDTIIENKWFSGSYPTPLESAWLGDFETAVELIARLNVSQAQ